MDSDFDIDENDEPTSDHDDEEKQKRKVDTKAYKACNFLNTRNFHQHVTSILMSGLSGR